MEDSSVCGNFFEAWDSPTKKQTVNNSSTSSMNNMTLMSNDIHIINYMLTATTKQKYCIHRRDLGQCTSH